MSEQIRKETITNRDYVFALFNDEGQVRKATDALKSAGFVVGDRNVWEEDDVGERPDRNGAKSDFMVKVKIPDIKQAETAKDILKNMGGHHIEFIEHDMKSQVPQAHGNSR